MNNDNYFYNCSKESIDFINPNLYDEIIKVISYLPKRQIQTEINNVLINGLRTQPSLSQAVQSTAQ